MAENQDLILSQQIEDLLVSQNLRGMKTVQPALSPGYCLRAARMISDCKGRVLISTGFPVNHTFETDGPVGAIALYRLMEEIGSKPVLVCGSPLARALSKDYRTHELILGQHNGLKRGLDPQAIQGLAELKAELIITIELPGQAADGCYYNMRGEDISSQTIFFDDFVRRADCPVVSIGDGGNELGMGNISDAVSALDIIPSATTCDELVIADVSNWAAHGLVAMLSHWAGTDWLGGWNNRAVLEYLVERGSVDGVTRCKTLTEDGLPCEETDTLIQQLRQLTGFC